MENYSYQDGISGTQVVTDAPKFFGFSTRNQGKKEISRTDLLFLCRQMSQMLYSGLSILNMFQILGESETELGDNAKIWTGEVKKGKSLIETFSTGSFIFPGDFFSIVSTGEATGTLDQTMKAYAEELAKFDKIDRKIKSLLIYPSFVMGFTLIILSVMFTVVLPRFYVTFEKNNIHPEGFTKLLFIVSNILSDIGVYVVVPIAVLMAMWIISSAGRKKIAKMLGIIPAMRSLMEDSAWAVFASMVGIALQSGLPLDKSIELAAPAAPESIKDFIPLITRNISSGKDLLNIENIVWPPMVKGNLLSGHETGKMSTAFFSISEYYSLEAEEKSSSLAAILEPILLLFVIFFAGIGPFAIIQTMGQLYTNMAPAK